MYNGGGSSDTTIKATFTGFYPGTTKFITVSPLVFTVPDAEQALSGCLLKQGMNTPLLGLG